jgi:hypothetical protein
MHPVNGPIAVALKHFSKAGCCDEQPASGFGRRDQQGLNVPAKTAISQAIIIDDLIPIHSPRIESDLISAASIYSCDIANRRGPNHFSECRGSQLRRRRPLRTT